MEGIIPRKTVLISYIYTETVIQLWSLRNKQRGHGHAVGCSKSYLEAFGMMSSAELFLLTPYSMCSDISYGTKVV
jgi:hypothetical protein